MYFVDSHCHLYYSPMRENWKAVLQRMREASVMTALCVSVDAQGDDLIDEMVLPCPSLLATAGVHPCDENISEVSLVSLMSSASRHDKIVAIGETGLDFYREPSEQNILDQKASLSIHMEVARQLKKPLVIHMRAATEALIDLFVAERVQDVGGVLHCYTEDCATAKKLLDLGLYISFSGIVTFKKSEELRRVAAYVPSDRYLIETDAPYLAPVPHRGKSNEPAFVPYVARCIAEVRHEPLEKVADDTRHNFFTFIGRDIVEHV